MKTSTRLIFTALMIVVVSLGIHNLALRAEYLKGTYRDVYYNYQRLGFKNFDEIQVNASNQLHVVIRQGDFAVMKQKNANDSVIFTQKGNRLIVDINYISEPSNDVLLNKSNSNVIIFCPKVSLLRTDNYYLINGHKPDTLAIGLTLNFGSPYYQQYVELEAFSTESLLIQQTRGILSLKANSIQNLKADVGTSSMAILNFSGNNQIKQASFNVHNESRLDLNDMFIPKLNYHIDPNAQINISGAMLKGNQ